MLSSAQQSLVESQSTRPIFVIEIQHGGSSELMSSSGRVLFDGRSYAAGGFNLRSIRDAESAEIELPFSSTRVAEIQSGSWRGGLCKIWAIIASPDDPEGTEYSASDGFLRLDGRIQSSRLSGNSITVSIVHALANSKVSPRHTYNSVCNFIPGSGAVIVWEGDSLTLESRR